MRDAFGNRRRGLTALKATRRAKREYVNDDSYSRIDA
jgi:hypothetical protein